MLTVEQAARLLQVSTHTIYGWSSQGLLAGAKARVGKHLRIGRDALVELAFQGKLNHAVRGFKPTTTSKASPTTNP